MTEIFTFFTLSELSTRIWINDLLFSNSVFLKSTNLTPTIYLFVLVFGVAFFKDYSAVFITAFQEYAVTAFKFNAIDFLLKPIDPKDLIATVKILEDNLKNKLFTTNPQLESAKTSIEAKTSDYNFIAIPSTKKIDFIKIDDILYFESDGRYTIIHLIDKTTFFVSKNIGEYDKILAPRYFFRIHKKYLINLKYIVNINNADGSNCELVGNLILPVAKRRKEDLVSFLNIK